MSRFTHALLAALFLAVLTGPANADDILDPQQFVTDLYQDLRNDQMPPAHEDDIFTPNLRALIDSASPLDFGFYFNGQDWDIGATTVEEFFFSPSVVQVVATFTNFGEPQVFTYVFVDMNGRWLIDEITNEFWVLSQQLEDYKSSQR